MSVEKRIKSIIDIGWICYKNKVASGLLDPENEKMMQLQLSLIFQTLIPIYEFNQNENIKILLEKRVEVGEPTYTRIIDIVILFMENDNSTLFPIELKCFRKFTRDNSGRKRGAGNLGMYDYWEDIENIELYSELNNFGFGTQLTLTDDKYYFEGKHSRPQVSIYSTNRNRKGVKGRLNQEIQNRRGSIFLKGSYSMDLWEHIGKYYFIRQTYNPN